MKIAYSKDESKKAAFFDALVGELSKVPFGTLGKRDLECLLLHQLIENGFLTTESSRALSNNLGINETRLKGYLVDIRYKYQEDKKLENVRSVIRDLFQGKKRFVHEKESFLFAIEDPIVKLDFEQALKDVGYFSDGTFNKEVVKIRDYALVAFFFRYDHDDHTYEQLQRMSAEAAKANADFVKKIDLKKTWLEIGKEILNAAQDSYGKVDTVLKIGRFLLTGSFT